LKLPKIEGIRGGGYLPHKNFSLNDLEDEEKDELIAEKPELAGLEHARNKYGDESPQALDALRDAMNDLDRGRNFTVDLKKLVTLNEEWAGTRKFVVVDTYADLETFLGNIDDNDLEKLVEYYNGTEKLDTMSSDLTHEQKLDVLNQIPEPSLNRLLAKLRLPKLSNSGAYNRRLLDKAVENLELDGDIKEIFEMSIDDSAFRMSDNLKDILKERIDRYIECGWYFKAPVHIDVDKNDFNKQINAVVSLHDIYEIVTDNLEPDGDDYGDREYVGLVNEINENGGWVFEEDYDSYMIERRKEDGLIVPKNNKIGKYSTSKSDYRDELLMDLENGSPITSKYKDEIKSDEIESPDDFKLTSDVEDENPLFNVDTHTIAKRFMDLLGI
jgi:hypothetical protein